MKRLAEVRKVIVSALSVVSQIVAAGVLHGAALHVAQAVLAVAGLGGVYAVKNAAKLGATS